MLENTLEIGLYIKKFYFNMFTSRTQIHKKLLEKENISKS